MAAERRTIRRPTIHRMLKCLFVVGIVASTALGSFAAEKAASGSTVAPFSLRDYHGRLYPSAELYNGKKFLVVAFLGIDCPLSKLYTPRLIELAERFESQGVSFVGIDSNRQDTVTRLTAFAQRMEIPFILLKDPDNAVADQMGATRVPEVFVLDAQGTVRYRGRVDDQYGLGFGRPEPTRQDLAVALEELIGGKDVSLAVTEAPGCLIGRVPKVEPHGEITYSDQVSRILAARCVECHRAGEIAPFPLTNYEEVVGWSDMIREVTSERRMPPWLADPRHGHFSNSMRLTDEELATITTWVENGSPEGDQSQLPEPPKFADGWRIEEPDAVYYMSDEPFTVAATGVVAYQIFTVDPGFKEDVWIQAAEARPGNRAVVHHHVAYFQPPGSSDRGGEVYRQIAGYAPGTPPFRFPEGVAVRIPAGSKIIFQMHYTPVGTEQQDRSYLGVVFADPKTVQREAHGEMVGTIGFRIPPGAADFHLDAKKKFRKDTVLLNLAPHMHVRGKAFRFELEHPDGRREVLLDVPKYDFNWQLRYDLVEPLLIRAGSTMHCYARYDNSADNPVNPDPTSEVRFGEQTWEEMMFGIYQTVEPAKPASAETSSPQESTRNDAPAAQAGN